MDGRAPSGLGLGWFGFGWYGVDAREHSGHSRQAPAGQAGQAGRSMEKRDGTSETVRVLCCQIPLVQVRVRS